MENTTDSLRALAPKWSLAGDEKLLNLLQDTHQKIVTKCREVNTKLDEMASALNTSSIKLQNVNNKFMALSNSQFVESRVYDDDEVTMETKPTEEPQTPVVIDNITLLKRSLAILDNAHETAEILDESESDDSDAEISVVLKARDAYPHRPLPHIIGSQAWKSKWHAGLIIEDSDTDSSTSKHDMQDIEQYSESDEDVQTDKHVPDTTISETSSSFHSERDKDLSSVPDKKQTPADIAAEIAARLGQAPPRVLEEPEDRLPQPTLKPVYRPQKPVSSTIFSDEPPPLETHQQFYSSDSQEDDDIFAEINKKQPYNNSSTAQSKMADDLFGRTVGSDFSDYMKEPKSAKQNATLFDDESEPELFVEKSPKSKEVSQKSKSDDSTIKKPVGGISLFGSNKGTETIGADILKRNRRRSSSDTDSGDAKNTIKYDAADDEDSDEGDANNANYIFDNLFAKAKQSEEAMARQAEERPVKLEKTKEVKNLFSDNIFDDIDDIFTSNIKIPTKEANKNAKSIFDDDDDLFADIARKTQTPKAASSGSNKDNNATSSSNNKSLFDSDDELFNSDKNVKGKLKTVETESQISKPSKENNNNDTTTSIQPVASKFDESQNVNAKESDVKPKSKSKSIFDSDSDDELFSDNKTKENTKNTENIFVEKKKTATIGVLDTENAKVFHSPSLFEEDEIDDLFINANKAQIANEQSVNTIIEHIIPEDIPDFIKKVEVTKEIPVFNKKVEETSKTNVKNIPKDIENKKPVIVDTKPYVFPEMVEPEPKPSELFDDKDDFLTNPKEIETVNTRHVMKDDVIETSQKPTKVQNKTSFIDAGIDSKLQEPMTNVTTDYIKKENVAHENETKGLFADSNTTSPLPNADLKAPKFDEPVKEELDVNLEQKKPISTAALFDDIFSEPPVFEKTKEIKKTINVNALFEDDSDDEALFFKKNDVISDEKPDIFSASGSFALFNDEPPALVEVDSLKVINSVFDDDDDLFSSIPEVNTTNIRDERNDEPISEDDKLDSNLFNSSQMPTSENKTVDITTKALNKVVPDSDDELFSNMPVPELIKTKKSSKPELKSNESNTDEISKDETETDKKIGKLNTKNFNINVQALVPGASPKKIHKERNDDTININKGGNDLENISKDNEASVSEVDYAKPKEAKSISFESKPDSGVLDNNLSKQRAKIQVKRRPSSRRARHEAVRKSVIGLDDDTDNSSSFDEPLPKTIQNALLKKESNEQNQNEPKTSVADKESKKKLETEDLSEHKINTDNVHKNVIDKVDEGSKKIFNIHDEITKGTIQSNKSLDVVDSKTAINEEKNEFSEDVPEREIVEDSINDNKSPQSTTKVVYILNDEDIFSNKTDEPKLEETDELFKTTSQSDDLFKNNEIKTIGNTYKEVSPHIESTATVTNNDFKPSKNIKVNDSFKNNKESENVQPTKKETKSLFDLSDEEEGDLFGKSTKAKKVEVKSKLFESDSEEDLFCGKKKDKGNKKVKEVKKVKDLKKTSLFGDDDDDDIFGVKTKTVLESSKVSTSTASKPTSSKDAAKSTETVFRDPLSMLDDD